MNYFRDHEIKVKEYFNDSLANGDKKKIGYGAFLLYFITLHNAETKIGPSITINSNTRKHKFESPYERAVKYYLEDIYDKEINLENIAYFLSEALYEDLSDKLEDFIDSNKVKL